MTDATNKQEGGDHYRSMKIQPVEFIHANNIPFIEGAVIKYVVRHRSKNGAQDIRKAIHCLELLLQLEYPLEEKISAFTDCDLAPGMQALPPGPVQVYDSQWPPTAETLELMRQYASELGIG